MDRSSIVHLRPYARLLTMLGEQLIKNDRIALSELIKNSYDADATRVQIRFENFGPNLRVTPQSCIVIDDNGDGMTAEVVRDHWLNPATSIKADRKRWGQPRSAGGRVVQGEKGIGRFAMFKLGSIATLVSRGVEERLEVCTELDIRFLDDDAAPGGTAPASQYLDELEVTVTEREPRVFTGSSDFGEHGTRLTIGSLRSEWSLASLSALHEDLLRLRPLTQLVTGRAGDDPLSFDITYLIDGIEPQDLTDPEALLDSVVPRAVLTVVGSYDAQSNSFDFMVNDTQRTVPLDSSEILGLDLYGRLVSKAREPRKFESGDFAFEFLVFDLRQSAEVEYQLNPVEKELIKKHRIYLYRDGVRVLPYGDADDDWLQLDTIRGTVGANRVLSNDQTIGFVYISQEGNPELRDKTNREGLIDSGPAYRDFIRLLQLFVNYLRKGDFGRYLQDSRGRSEAEDRKQIMGIDARVAEIRGEVAGVPAAARALDELVRAYSAERTFMQTRVERSEDLAGVGLSVETASHDVIASANQAYRDVATLVEQLGFELGTAHSLTRRSASLAESISFIVSRLQDVQGLFVSSRGRPKKLDLAQYVRKVESIYSRTLREEGICLDYAGDGKLEAVTHEATLLQIFLNLVDNAIYWLRVGRTERPQILVTIDADGRELVFSDNGPGVNRLDVPYIFEPFFSAKGDEGRGLGLYIARQVARRDGLELELLGGAVVSGSDRVPATFRLRVAK